MYHLRRSDIRAGFVNAEVRAGTKRRHDCLRYVTDMYTLGWLEVRQAASLVGRLACEPCALVLDRDKLAACRTHMLIAIWKRLGSVDTMPP